MSKRDLPREVLLVFVRSKTLAKLGMDWQANLQRSAAEDNSGWVVEATDVILLLKLNQVQSLEVAPRFVRIGN